jgi:plasmid stabilization system protein ParE
LDKYIVKLLSKAYQDIEQIYNYISQNFEEKEIALKLVNDIEDTIFSLESFPYRGAE